MRVVGLLACFNRRELTLRCLEDLFGQRLPAGIELEVVLVDDGSRDGTAEAVRGRFPEVQVIEGAGDLYWCGGMRVAWQEAARSDPDFYLLLNDDTLLEPTAVRTLLGMTDGADSRCIAVAAIRDAVTGAATYGCHRRQGGLVPPDGTVQSCDTFNANCAVIPRAVFRELGVFHDRFTHGMGDFDYGFQANDRGIRVRLSTDFLGTCSQNPVEGSWLDRSLSRSARLRILRSPKGLPFGEWAEFNRRNYGWRWPIRTVSPYLRVLIGR